MDKGRRGQHCANGTSAERADCWNGRAPEWWRDWLALESQWRGWKDQKVARGQSARMAERGQGGQGHQNDQMIAFECGDRHTGCQIASGKHI